jgi:16S rRNA (cytosine1402-N4)-methyltransferase
MKHIPVLLNEVTEGLAFNEGETFLDATIGFFGHSSKAAEKIGEAGKIIGIDRDQDTLQFIATSFLGSNAPFREGASNGTFPVTNTSVELHHSNFNNLKEVLKGRKIDKALFDLGVSSEQIDDGERGFSFAKDAALDMRMDKKQKLTAKDVINNYSKENLAKIISEYGQEPFARKIAENIANKREEKEIETTGELLSIIEEAIPKKAKKKGYAETRKVFQAIRIEVNDELSGLEGAITDAYDSLNEKGRVAVISFHSLEDRIVKKTFNELDGANILTKKPITASEKEMEENSRAKPAKLRIAEKI